VKELLFNINCLTSWSKGGCTGFEWPGFGSGGAAGVVSVRSCQKLLPCLIEPMSAGSKTDPTLAKGEISVMMIVPLG